MINEKSNIKSIKNLFFIVKIILYCNIETAGVYKHKITGTLARYTRSSSASRCYTCTQFTLTHTH